MATYDKLLFNANPYQIRVIGVTMSLIIDQENAIRSQSFTTPATFMVKAKVLPTSKNTTRFKAKAQVELVPKITKSK